MTTQTKPIILAPCNECGEEASIVGYLFKQDHHRWDELTIRGIPHNGCSSETMIHYEGFCRNCVDRLTFTQLINLN